MGQIVSIAAKPKRCNANHLSQVPTPATGEHILVSSENSMNAAGQGNFDCYIVGDGKTAATALELKPIANGQINIGDKRAVNGGTLYNELRDVIQVENIAKFVNGGYVKSDGSIGAISNWKYVDKLDISSYVKLTIRCCATSAGYNILFDEDLNILYRWQSGSAPYITEIDLNDYPTAKFLSVTNSTYAFANPYVNAEIADNITTKEKIRQLSENVKEAMSDVDSVKYKSTFLFDIPITKATGFITNNGDVNTNLGEYVQYVDISEYSYVTIFGKTNNAAYNVIFDADRQKIVAKQGSPQVTFDIANEYPNAKYLSACSVDIRTLAISGIKKTSTINKFLQNASEDFFINNQKIRITKLDGFYAGNRQYSPSNIYSGSKSNLLAVKEGMTFVVSSDGSSNTLNYIMYNDKLEMISIIKNNTFVKEEITIPVGTCYIEFFSLTSLSISCEQLISSDDENAALGNVLYRKSYVAIGDSFTAPIGSETIESGIYKGQSKVYPYIIGNRNNMTVINQGFSGTTLNRYLADSRYNAIPENVDYVTIWYGINDIGHGIDVGTIDDEPTTISAEGGTTTCGGFNFFFKWLLTNRPLAHVGVIITDFCGQTRREAIIACCEKWGIPYLDLYDPTIPMIRTRGNTRYTHDTAIAPLGYVEVCAEAKALRNTIFSTDPANTNMHPNNTCHEWQSNLIEQFMRGL